MHDVRIIESRRNHQRPQGVASRCVELNEQAVRRVVHQLVEREFRSNAIIVRREFTRSLKLWRVEIGFLEAVRGRRNRRVGAFRNEIVRNRRTGLNDLNRLDNLLNAIDNNTTTTAVPDIGMIDVVQEDALIFKIIA